MVLKKGSFIRVRAFGGKEITRRFLKKCNSTVLICSDEEYRAALAEKRPPTCVGFPVSDVVETSQTSRLTPKITKRKLKPSTRGKNV